MRLLNSILALLILACIAPVRPLASDFPNLLDFDGSNAQRRTKWSTKTIRVSLSTSLTSPASGITPESDIVAAVHRALDRWSNAANIRFEAVSSKVQSISPVSGGDGISLITIAETAENLAIFGGGHHLARTRVLYDPQTGEIVEADVAINPHPVGADGTVLRFSTDGTPGTYDLESTLMHEIGHFLGLDHSYVIGSTMRAHQGVNGTYKLPAFTERTLTEDDRTRVRTLYGSAEVLSSIEGKLTTSSWGGHPVSLQGAHVWVEESGSGRVVASGITSASGNYRIESIPSGQYRVLAEYLDGPGETEGSFFGVAMNPGNHTRAQRAFRSVELRDRVRLRAGTTTRINFVMVPPQNGPPLLKPRLLGTNGDISATPLPAEAGKKLTIYVGGEGVDQVPISGIAVMSPFMTIDPDSLTVQQFGTLFPVIGFDVTVADHVSFGDYSIRLQSNSGEVAYLPGGLTIDPGVNTAAANPVDDSRFFINQHYRDFLGREPLQLRVNKWIDELESCRSDADCARNRRLDVSAGFIEDEFLETWSFIYRVYKATLGRRPTLLEFNSDRLQIVDDPEARESSKLGFTKSFVVRQEFLEKYGAGEKIDKFLDQLISSLIQSSELDLFSERSSLAALYDGTTTGRAKIIQRLADHPTLAKKESSKAFVLAQYFGYLRREPDESGYNFWLSTLDDRTGSDSPAHRAMVCAFITSAEYQSRFGMYGTRKGC
ncbi:MAG: matrixin family metalloprotease [Pyrinomonadaceae bacterium]|nr:matrixin family metalloprotease [Pyrinomonadaceae bacterium]